MPTAARFRGGCASVCGCVSGCTGAGAHVGGAAADAAGAVACTGGSACATAARTVSCARARSRRCWRGFGSSSAHRTFSTPSTTSGAPPDERSGPVVTAAHKPGVTAARRAPPRQNVMTTVVCVRVQWPQALNTLPYPLANLWEVVAAAGNVRTLLSSMDQKGRQLYRRSHAS